jgi:hypothetical protein
VLISMRDPQPSAPNHPLWSPTLPLGYLANPGALFLVAGMILVPLLVAVTGHDHTGTAFVGALVVLAGLALLRVLTGAGDDHHGHAGHGHDGHDHGHGDHGHGSHAHH